MFVLALFLCGFAECNGYVIATDTEWNTQAPCETALVRESNQMAKVWGGNPKGVQAYLNRFNVKEDPQTLVDYDYTCEWIADRDIP
ncbi:hypothetical protein phiK7A1_167 [Pseudomonas phage phiK7A1]|uniref:Uncharacterized protein n=1 Tax=Pseudomonas phage phiK7A1 TaxID=2759194 RepID=A0A7H0XG15_9CAUD|nr:hypothetical protein phiK7A1_167 [Pseudomonas phage phiK7A1]